MLVIVPKPISELRCSDKFTWRELSRMVLPWTSSRYLLSSSVSHNIMAVPSLSIKALALVWSRQDAERYSPNWGRPCNRQGRLRQDQTPNQKGSTHCTTKHLHDIKIRVLDRYIVLEGLDPFDDDGMGSWTNVRGKYVQWTPLTKVDSYSKSLGRGKESRHCDRIKWPVLPTSLWLYEGPSLKRGLQLHAYHLATAPHDGHRCRMMPILFIWAERAWMYNSNLPAKRLSWKICSTLFGVGVRFYRLVTVKS